MSSHSDAGPQLNAAQRRSIEALLESLENTLHELERLMPDSSERTTGVVSVMNDLPAGFIQDAPGRVQALREHVGALAERIHLSRRKVSKRRAVRGMLSAQVVRLEDITPARLRNYGEVHPSFGEEILPGIQEMRAELRALLLLLHE